MHEPNLRTSRLAIAAGLAAAIAMAGAGFYVGRKTTPRPAEVAVPHVAPSAEPSPVIEGPRRLGRTELIGIASAAADALASGSAIPETVREAAGRRFELVLPFGCEGPSGEASTAPLRWRYDAKSQTLRVSVRPVRWSLGDWSVASEEEAGGGFLKGYWLSRPWSTADRCPRPQTGDAQAVQAIASSGETLALAEAEAVAAPDARTQDRPFEAVERVAADQFSAPDGFRLRLIGRIGRLPGGSPVKCVQRGGIDDRPVCVIVAAFDELRVEWPSNGAVLATWSLDARSRASQ